MVAIDADGLTFSFEDSWLVCKYDDFSFYRNRFASLLSGIKAIDILAIDTDRAAWLIEIKDYTSNQRTKPSDLGDEVGLKVLHTLSAMLPCKLNAVDENERRAAAKVLKATKLRVVLHLEQPAKHSKLFPRAIKPADIVQKLRIRLRAVDAHPVVVEMNGMGTLGWTVHRTPDAA